MVDENRGKRIAPGYVQVCSKCQGKFNVSVFGEGYPNRDDEYVFCPHCGNHEGYVRTSGYVTTSKA
ncbi:hypothetical protein HRD65_13035 [Lactococcus lactis subsp. lactis]|uniref:hypothetical protein n=1 Tax=Lactococcus lactis TaxID=1358 RepID=UPI00155DFAE0|nr:hypothetical protein [Lactococcus lactis]NRD18350.1 hypothetical protein [Lactococcus lactis subsp. lactis]